MKYTGPLYAKIPGTRKYVKLREDSEYVDNLETKLAEARAEIERLKSEHEDSLRRAKDNAVSLSGTVTEYAGELLVRDKLIEQMLEALEAIIKRFQPEQHDAAGCMFKNCELCKAIAVIKAAKGEI